MEGKKQTLSPALRATIGSLYLSVGCPFCRATAGEWCKARRSGNRAPQLHLQRCLPIDWAFRIGQDDRVRSMPGGYTLGERTNEEMIG